jgi:hypothetical protein
MAGIAARYLGRAMFRYAPRAYGAIARNYYRQPQVYNRILDRAIQGGRIAVGATVAQKLASANILGTRGKGVQAAIPQEIMAAATKLPYDKGTQTRLRAAGKSKRTGTGSGIYKGRFVRRKKRVMKKTMVDFSKFGVAQTIEEYGEVDDPDTVYAINPCANDVKIMECLIASLVKKLLMMGIKWTPTAWDDEILYGPGGNTVNPAGLFIGLYGGRPDTTDGIYDTVVGYNLQNGDTINTIVSQFINSFNQYSNGTLDIGGTVNTNNELYSMSLGCLVRNSADNAALGQVLSTIYFDNETVHWKGSSRMKVQNRTNNISGTATTDVNDAKPLEGYLYMFSGLPRLRNPATGDFKNINNGVCTKTFGAATTNADFKEPVPAKVFANCSSRKRIRLDPGEIKEVTVYGTGKMSLKPFLKKLIVDESGGLTIHTMFKSQMIGLEEVINSTDANAVKIGFENSNYHAVTTVTKKKKIVTVPRYRVINVTETA